MAVLGIDAAGSVRRVWPARVAALALVTGAATLVGAATPARADVPAFQQPPLTRTHLTGATLGVTAGPDGAAWVLEANPPRVARVALDGTAKEWTIFGALTNAGVGQSITTGPDGALWFVEQNPPAIGRITTSGLLTVIPLAGDDDPVSIIAGTDGRLWFTEYGNGFTGYGVIDPTTHDHTRYPTSGYPEGLTVAHGALWSTVTYVGVQQIATDGTITTHAAPCCFPTGITTGPDGDVWAAFASGSSGPGTVAHFDAPGHYVSTSVPLSYIGPLVFGPDGAMWTGPGYPSGQPAERVTPDGTSIPVNLHLYYTPSIAVLPSGRVVAASGDTRDVVQLDLTPTIRFVDHVYTDVLGRAVDASGLTYWTTGLLAGSQTSAQLARVLVATDEYLAYLVTGIYQQFMNRAPDPGGLAYWIDQLRSGRPPNALRALFTGSDEYFAAAGNDIDAYVTAVYHDVLSRSPDDAGAAYWASQLRGGTNRMAVTNSVLGSDEAVHRLVASLYQHFLQRDPDGPGADYWTTRIQAGTSELDLAALLAGSAEYWARP